MISNKLPEKFSDEELTRLMAKISKSTYKFFLRQIDKELFNGYYNDIPLEFFMSVFCVAMANTDGNLIRWLASFAQSITKKDPDIQSIKTFFKAELENCLNQRIGKH